MVQHGAINVHDHHTKNIYIKLTNQLSSTKMEIKQQNWANNNHGRRMGYKVDMDSKGRSLNGIENETTEATMTKILSNVIGAQLLVCKTINKIQN